MPVDRLAIGIVLRCLPELSESSELIMSLPVISVSCMVYVPALVRLIAMFTASSEYQELNGFFADANK